MNDQTRPWYRESAMMVVIGVLTFTLLSGSAMLTIALSSHDPIVISDDEYQQLRDEFRATQSRATQSQSTPAREADSD